MPENEGSGDADIGSKTQAFDSQTSEIYSLQTTTIISCTQYIACTYLISQYCASIAACKVHDQRFMILSRE